MLNTYFHYENLNYYVKYFASTTFVIFLLLLLKDYIETRKYKNAETDDLWKHLKKVL